MLIFTEWLLSNCEEIPDILWSNKTNFSLDVTVNTHNCRFWSNVKPDRCITQSLHSPKLCVWMGLSSRFGLQPVFFEETVNSNRYLHMLMTHVQSQLVQRGHPSRTIFVQDGASPNFLRDVCSYLRETFSEERIIRRGCARE